MTFVSATGFGSYDDPVRHVCVNPKGVMAGVNGGTFPSYSMAFRAAIQ